MKRVQIEYGPGFMEAELSDTAEIFIPGETIPDPPYLEDPEPATRESIQNPVGMPQIPKLVENGAKVTISFPDKVKGGFQKNSHRKTSIPILIEECLKAGVEKKDIKLICATGLHRKNTAEELKAILGEKVYNEFMPNGQVVNHDSEDWENLVDLGTNELGDRVILNKSVFESDLPILIGHVLANPYGGYSGGYKMAATGMSNWRSIACHHILEVLCLPDFVPASPNSTLRRKFDAIGQYMEKCMGKKFFMCDAVADTRARQIAIFSGYGKQIQPLSWEVADKRTYVPWAKHKFDIMMFGMPQQFHYGNGHGTNPILMLQAIAANIVRHKRVMKDNCVVICSSMCNGYFHDEEFPSFREVYELYQTNYHHDISDMSKYGEYIATRQHYIDIYRYKYGYHPYHAFVNLNFGQIAMTQCAAIYIVGAQEPGYARGVGMKTKATFDAALKDAQRYTGKDPKVLILPKTFTTAGVHLMMKDQKI
jgi:nickel-dependent lactate racemase